jgi:hypothetical protein
VRHRCGGGWHGIEAHAEEEQSVRHWCGGGRHDIMADAEKERALVGVWRGNDSSQG